MKRILKSSNILVILLSLTTSFRMDAQVYLHIDRDKYIAGEDVWFSIYSTDPETGKLSSESAIAYIELLNPWSAPVIQKRFPLSGGRGNGVFLLPDSLSSGTYTIRAYTNWMKDFLPGKCFMHDIDIFNPFKGTGFRRKTSSSGSALSGLPFPSNENAIRITSDTLFNKREKITLKVQIGKYGTGRAEKSEISISVTPSEVTSVSRWIDYSISPGEGQHELESEGHFLSGRVRYRDGNVTDSSEFLYMSIQGKVADFKYAHIDTSGRFSFIMPVDTRLRRLILQPENPDNNMTLEIEPSFSWIIPESNSFSDTLTGDQLALFSELSFNYQTGKIYGTTLKKEIAPAESSNFKRRRFYGIPEMEIILDDYISLPVMQEVFFELVPGIILRTRRGGYELKITNPLTGNFYEEPPLVMIDGVIINDLNVLAGLDPEKVEKIEVVQTPYLIGDLVLHGIVNVITRAGDFSDITMPEFAVVLPYRVIDDPYVFSPPEHNVEPAAMRRIPDLRNTLYWNPSVKTDINGEADIEFFASDAEGVYTINIQGISADGEKNSVNKKFRIK
jgi:hypothetical protein